MKVFFPLVACLLHLISGAAFSQSEGRIESDPPSQAINQEMSFSSAHSGTGLFGFKLIEQDGNEWSLQVYRDTMWQYFEIPINLFGSGSGFLNTPVIKFLLQPVGGGSIGTVSFEVTDWIDRIVLGNTTIDDFESGDFSNWHLEVALNGSYLQNLPDSLTPDGSQYCMRLVHGNSMTSTFAGWLEKNFAGIQVSPADTLKFWLRGVSYMLNDIKEEFPITQTFRLDQNYPNPFNPTTQIQYNLPLTSFVTLKVYDVMGRELVTLVSQRQDPGLYSVKLDVGSFAASIYFYRLQARQTSGGQAGTFTETKKLVLLR